MFKNKGLSPFSPAGSVGASACGRDVHRTSAPHFLKNYIFLKKRSVLIVQFVLFRVNILKIDFRKWAEFPVDKIEKIGDNKECMKKEKGMLKMPRYAKQTDDRTDVRYEPNSRSRKSRHAKKQSPLGMIVCVLVIVLCVVGIVAMILHMSSPPQESTAQSSAPPAASSAPAASVPAQESKPPAETKPAAPVLARFESSAKFTKNNKLISADIKQILDDTIGSDYVVLYDVTTDQILYEKAASEKCYPASTTKLMTAIVSSRYLKKSDVIEVGDEITLIGYDSSIARLRKGMKLTYEMLLDAMMLPSGNDAAYTIAVATARAYKMNPQLSIDDAVAVFADLMNKAAKDLGCKGTHFAVPDGFHDDDHYVTAGDMLRIAAYAVQTPIVMNACGKTEATWKIAAVPEESSDREELDPVDTNEDEEVSADYYETETEESSYAPPDGSPPPPAYSELYWQNTNQLLDKYSYHYSQYATGLKTGFTDQALTCVISSATISNHTMITVVMHATNDDMKYDDTNRLFKLGFQLFNLKYKYANEPDVDEWNISSDSDQSDTASASNSDYDFG